LWHPSSSWSNRGDWKFSLAADQFAGAIILQRKKT
jgi:hypothetical protein